MSLKASARSLASDGRAGSGSGRTGSSGSALRMAAATCSSGATSRASSTRLTTSVTASVTATIASSFVATGELTVPGENTSTTTTPLTSSRAALTAKTRHDSDR